MVVAEGLYLVVLVVVLADILLLEAQDYFVFCS